jgi:threonine/homoserine/homoserine lactone efflux protein
MFSLSSSIDEGKHPFQAGFMISFLASLLPGIVNILTIQLAITESYIVASWFALGALSAELICAKICLLLLNRVYKFATRILEWLVLLVLVAFSIMSLIASVNGTVPRATNAIRNDLPPFIFGFLTMAINPGLAPFWLGWTTIVSERKILKPNKTAGYLVGIGFGSLIASAIFIGCGHFLFSALMIEERVLHFIFGCVFSIMTFAYAGKLLRIKRAQG